MENQFNQFAVSGTVKAQIKGWLAGSRRVLSEKNPSLPPKEEQNIIPPTQTESRDSKSFPPGVSPSVNSHIKGWLAGSRRVIADKTISRAPMAEQNILPPTRPENRASKPLGVSPSVNFHIKGWLAGSRRVISEKNTKTLNIPKTGEEIVPFFFNHIEMFLTACRGTRKLP
jgi:hypothetical protein